jgi:hypothetical protein
MKSAGDESHDNSKISMLSKMFFAIGLATRSGKRGTVGEGGALDCFWGVSWLGVLWDWDVHVA